MSHKQDAAKNRILQAAISCFAANGYDQTSVRQICEAAEANLAMVSYYYGSKEQLYYAVLDQWFKDANPGFNLSAEILDPREELERFIRTFLHLRNEDPQFNMLLRYELSSQSPRSEFIRKLMSPYLEHLNQILATGKEKNLFQYESLELISTFILSILVYPAYDSFLLQPISGEPPAWEDEIKQTIDFVIAGLQTR
ncbi:TetR/AcrR family transcriptional regulator [Paenibacillus senegalensis]|uniref:TetR/AcrR family transcriptional regulator n=1 Tax=Paenibacillus senegalensis TaxID=1465766 RepID=UPI000288F74B|nr:TetR family transcriptional regulator [Paenibacillus senegalensis]